MKRPRKFLAFILVLLLINTLFFLAWYTLDLQDVVKGIVEREAGKALKGKFQIGGFHISDQQVYATKISFRAQDGSLNFDVNSARVRFNLLRFIFSGFKIRNILNQTEIYQADLRFAYTKTPEPPKPKKKFELPDLTPWFNDLRITDSKVRADVNLPLKLTEIGDLELAESLSGVNLRVVNSTGKSKLSLSANTHSKGILSANAVLEKGRLVSGHAELSNYTPLKVSHPQIQDASTEMNLVLDASQPVKGSRLKLEGKAILWDTRALLLSQYPVRIPYLSVSSDGDKLVADISQSSVGSSSIAGNIALSGLQRRLNIEPSNLAMQLDLGMLGPEFSGLVDVTLDASGSPKEPVANLILASPLLSFSGQTVTDVALEGNYADEEFAFILQSAVWQNTSVRLAGAFDTKYRKLLATLETEPVSNAFSELKLRSDLELEVTLYEKLPEVKALITDLSVAREKISFEGVSGYLNLFPATQGKVGNYYVDLELTDSAGTQISLAGDLLDRVLVLDANLAPLALADFYPQEFVNRLTPVLGGQIKAYMNGDRIVASSDLGLKLNSGLNVDADLDLAGTYDLVKGQGFASLKTRDASLNGQDIALDLVAAIDRSDLTLHSLQLNDQIFLSGRVDLADLPQELAFDLAILGLDSDSVTRYYPELQIPEFTRLNLASSYNLDSTRRIRADLSVGQVDLPGLRPLVGTLSLDGYPEDVAITASVNNPYRQLLDLSGRGSIGQTVDMAAQLRLSDLAVSDVVVSPPAEGKVSGVVGLAIADLAGNNRQISFDTDLSSPLISIPGMTDLENIVVRITQTPQLLTVDTLSVSASQYASVACSGALDYNLLTQSFYEGSHSLQADVEGYFFEWLDTTVDYITAAEGQSSLQFSVRTQDDQFFVESGNLRLEKGMIALKDQPEQIRNIDISAVFNANRLELTNATCSMGKGKLIIENDFEDDPGSHFGIGFLDLGTFRLKIDEPGIRVNIPMFTEPRSSSNVVLRGQNSPWATVKGPFDDMDIKAEALVYDAEAVYPPNTDNLLNLIYSFGSVFGKDETPTAPPPLPFKLDAMIRFRDNIRYTTYPANLSIQPDGYLRIVYDGQVWKAAEASFYSEQGTIDFFGTVFQADELSINIMESQDLLDISGTFFRRAEDGTVVTLNITTDPDNTKPIFSRISISLQSDNPADLTIQNILSRLSYKSTAGKLADGSEQNVLRDEALNLISDNLNTSLIAPVLMPLENFVRRALKLDDVSINAGFIQNLFTEYTSDPNQLAGYTGMNQFMGDVARFSSSILLNNLSVSASKYLGRKLYLDYKVTLQEATDLENQTRINVSHDTSLRLFLPEQFRVTYTLKYEHANDKFTHEVMLLRSFRFWGP